VFNEHKIYIPKYNLKSGGWNKVSLHFQNTYVTNSSGFHRYVDPVDGEVYVYTHLEPFNCNRWFPCFDQPSIRAPMLMRVILADSKWVAISNEKLVKSESLYKDTIIEKEGLEESLARLGFAKLGQRFDGTVHTFDKTPPISTYIYALAVGPYCSIPNESGYRVPMKIYCRKTKVPLAEAKERFRTIEIAIDFFEDYF
jgi:aminopeptidase N